MSGICGLFKAAPDIDVAAATSAMLDTLTHRGPDEASICADQAAGAALGHVHLNAFADPRDATPMFAGTGDVAIALDGAVTNAAELLKQETFGSGAGAMHRDVRAALAAYLTDGSNCLSTLDGPFSLALWDRRRETLLVARDKLGEKSVYYSAGGPGTRTCFASEIKAILSRPEVNPELDPDSVALYFAFGYIPGRRTLFKGINKLLPGESLRVDRDGRVETVRYWHLPPIEDGLADEPACIRQLRDLLMRALERYVNGCRDVAVFLSGGMDSSIIVAGLRELGVPRIHTFTIGFRVDGATERIQEDLAYARMVAERFSTEHHEVVIERGHDPGKDLLRVIRQFDDLIMTPNSYSKYLLAQSVRRAGLTSVLTGSAAAGACGVHRKFLDPEQRAALERKTRECRTDEERYYKLRSRLFKLEEQKDFLSRPPRIGKEDILEVLHEYIGGIRSSDFFRLFLFSNLMITSTEKTLRVLDRAGALASVEIRSPYLDRALVEFSARLPASFDGGRSYVSMKTHLKKAFERDLPKPVLDRAVIGYPSYYWNRGELTSYQNRLFFDGATANGIFNHEGVRRILERERLDPKSAGKPAWALTQFGLWYEIYVKQNPEYL